MNHLAHLFLAPDSPQARVGSILGDFAKGVSVDQLPAEVRRGFLHHLSVDGYTDRHPQVRASKRLFSRQRRRFAGVALDILYDHYLLKHWYRFSDCDSDCFIAQVYREFGDHEHLMPESMVDVTRRIVADDWFGHYRDLENVGFALDRVTRRIRFPNQFQGIIDEIRQNSLDLEDRFILFFSDLVRYLDSNYEISTSDAGKASPRKPG